MLDKAASGTAHAKNTFIRSKESAESTRGTGYNSSSEYAADNLTDKTKGVTQEAANRLRNPHKKAVENVNKAKERFQEVKRNLPNQRKQAAEQAKKTADNAKQTADILKGKAEQMCKTAEQAKKAVTDSKRTFQQTRQAGHQSIKSAKQAGKGVKATGKDMVKTVKKSVKTAERTARVVVKTAKQTAKTTQQSAKAAVKAAKLAAQASNAASKAAVAATKAEALGCTITFEGGAQEDAGGYPILKHAIREAMTNAIRHAGANEMTVQMHVQEDTLYAVMKDNGNRLITSISEGSGLSTLRSRIEQAGGNMEIRCGGGVELHIKFLRRQNNGKYETKMALLRLFLAEKRPGFVSGSKMCPRSRRYTNDSRD